MHMKDTSSSHSHDEQHSTRLSHLTTETVGTGTNKRHVTHGIRTDSLTTTLIGNEEPCLVVHGQDDDEWITGFEPVPR